MNPNRAQKRKITREHLHDDINELKQHLIGQAQILRVICEDMGIKWDEVLKRTVANSNADREKMVKAREKAAKEAEAAAKESKDGKKADTDSKKA